MVKERSNGTSELGETVSAIPAESGTGRFSGAADRETLAGSDKDGLSKKLRNIGSVRGFDLSKRDVMDRLARHR